MSPADFFSNATIPLREIFHSVKIDTEMAFNGTSSFTVGLDSAIMVNGCEIKPYFPEKEYYFNGLCYALSLPQCVLSLGVLELGINLLQTTDVFIHMERS